MDGRELILQHSWSLKKFFKTIIHRIAHGNAPLDSDSYNFSNMRLPISFPFDSHPGPIEDAVSDAKNMNRSIFLFIYHLENPSTAHLCRILQNPDVSNEVRSNFIFLPIDVTSPEGWSTAVKLRFQQIPFIALIRPKESFDKSVVFIKHEGNIGENTLLSSLRVENHERAPHTQILGQQNIEFHDELERVAENERRQQEEQAMKEEEDKRLQLQKEIIEKQFQELPNVDDSTNVATVKFQFPNNETKTHRFPRDESINLIFVFVRKYMFPKKFKLMTSFPQFQIPENNDKISHFFSERNFMIYVEEYEHDE